MTLDTLLLAFYGFVLLVAGRVLWRICGPLETLAISLMLWGSRWADGRCTQKRNPMRLTKADRELGVRV